MTLDMYANGVSAVVEKPKTVAELKAMVSRFAIHATVDEDGVVSVDNMMGNGQYLAKAPAELYWLKANSYEVEPRGSVTKYHIRLGTEG